MSVTFADMLAHLRAKFPKPTVPILRPPGSYGFIELTREEWQTAIDDLEKLVNRVLISGEKATELEKLGIKMLLGWDYDYFMTSGKKS